MSVFHTGKVGIAIGGESVCNTAYCFHGSNKHAGFKRSKSLPRGFHNTDMGLNSIKIADLLSLPSSLVKTLGRRRRLEAIRYAHYLQ